MSPERANRISENKSLISKYNKNKVNDYKRVKSAVGFNSKFHLSNFVGNKQIITINNFATFEESEKTKESSQNPKQSILMSANKNKIRNASGRSNKMQIVNEEGSVQYNVDQSLATLRDNVVKFMNNSKFESNMSPVKISGIKSSTPVETQTNLKLSTFDNPTPKTVSQAANNLIRTLDYMNTYDKLSGKGNTL